MGSRELRRRKIILHKRENGKCYWCGCDTILIESKRGVKDILNMATIDHLDDKLSGNRKQRSGNEERTVLSCWECNNGRNRIRLMLTPLSILRRYRQEVKLKKKNSKVVADHDS